MVEWFKNLPEGWQTAIFAAGVTVGLAATGGLFGLFKWLSSKKGGPVARERIIEQEGKGQTAIIADNIKGVTNIAGGDNITGIDPKAALTMLVETSTRLGREQREKDQLRDDLEKTKGLVKAEVKDAIKDVVKEVLIDILEEKEPN